MKKIRIVIMLALAIFGGGVSARSATAATISMYVVDKCNGSSGTNYPNNSTVSAFCATNSGHNCSSSSSSVWLLFSNTTYHESCGVFRVYNKNGTSLGRYLMCAKSGEAMNCINYKDDNNYCGTGHVSAGLVYNTTSTSVTLSGVTSFSTAAFDCCKTCNSFPAFVSQNDGCEAAQPNTCLKSGNTCQASGVAASTVWRCKDGYYDENGWGQRSGNVNFCTTTGIQRLDCVACPDNVWENDYCHTGATSAPYVSGAMQFEYEYVTNSERTACTKTSTGNKRCSSKYYGTPTYHSSLAEYYGCYECPSAWQYTVGNSSGSSSYCMTFSEGHIESDVTNNTTIAGCYVNVPSGKGGNTVQYHTDDTGTFTMAGHESQHCNYSTTAVNNYSTICP